MNSIAFMHAAYIVVWVVLGGYSADLFARYLKLKKELRELKSNSSSANVALPGKHGQTK